MADKTPPNVARPNARRDERRAKIEARRRQEAARQRNLTILKIAIGVLAVALLGFIVFLAVQAFTAPPVGESVSILGRDHIAVGQEHIPYNSNPPTSGPHYAEPAPPGAYDRELPDETLVHNLEHGYIWLSYKDCSDTATADQLKAIRDKDSDKVIITCRPKNDTKIAVASWGKLLKLDAVDEDKIAKFRTANRYKAPEPNAA